MDEQAPKGLFCIWIEDGGNWRCRRCNALVPTSVSADRPFAGCKIGMKELGVTPTDLVKATPRNVVPQEGPGTELKAMLSWLGIAPKPDCSCNQRAAQMNLWGADVCEQRMDEIVGWLREEAAKRKLPFIEAAARKVVKWAIQRSRKTTQ